MKKTSLLFSLILFSCASSRQGESGVSIPPSEEGVGSTASVGMQAPQADVSEEVRTLVFNSQNAGFLRHDFNTYIALWADDGRLIVGRSEEPAATDTVWDYPRLYASRRMRFRSPTTTTTLDHEDVEVEVSGENATLRCRTISGGEDWTEEMREVYRLRLTSDGWRIVENRAWPISKTINGEELIYSQETWSWLDRAFNEALDRGDTDGAVNAAVSGYRYREAFETARDAASIGDALAHDPLRYGHLAILLGEESEALEAFREARRRDPTIDVPRWALE